MRKQLSKIALAASIMLAMAFTLSCSDDKDDNSPGTGGGSDTQFNENSQVYYSNGTLFKGSGTLYVAGSYDHYNDGSVSEWNGVPIGSIVNGIVNLNSSLSAPPSEYLNDFLNVEALSCSSYPEGIKAFGGNFVLTNDNRDFLGSLDFLYKDQQIAEAIYYTYFSKEGKINCERPAGTGKGETGAILNLDVKVGWNKMYMRTTRNPALENKTNEYSTDNILTKKLKWVIEED